MKSNNYELEKWSLSKIWELKEGKKLYKPEWQRELKLESGYKERFVNSALDGDLNQSWILADLKTCDGFEDEIKNGKEYSYEDCQHRLAALEGIMKTNYFKDDDEMREFFLSVEVPVYIVKDRNKEELSKKFSRVNGAKTVSNDHTLYIEPTKLNSKIKSELIVDSNLVKSIYGIKKQGTSSEKVFYGNVIKMIKVCSSYEGLSNSQSTKYGELLKFLNTDKEIKSFNGIFNLLKNEWFGIIKDLDRKKDMWQQSSWFFILHINKVKKLKYDMDKLSEIYDDLIKTKHINNKTGAEINITRCSPEKRYELILNVFGYEK
jgi:hypothetical protein